MLAAAIAAGAMQPLALLLLDAWGKVPSGPAEVFGASVNSAIAVGFAYLGARAEDVVLLHSATAENR